MTRWQQTWEVARWEFARFVKWRQQLIGVGIMLGLGAAIAFFSGLSAKAKARPVVVAPVGAEALGFPLPAVVPLVWDSSTAWTEAQARAAVADERLDGALLVGAFGEAELVLRRRAAWTGSLESALTAGRQGEALARIATTPEERATLLAPFTLRTTFIATGAAPVARSTKLVVVAMLGLGLTILLSGFGTLFAGITGEKQQRVTEQLMAMITPQVWIDGKILGLAAVAFVGTAFLVAGLAVLGSVIPAALGRAAIAVPPIASDYGVLALVALATLLGVAMWFAFMAAVAATIDDPNSSTRSLLLFVPVLPIVLTFTLLAKADTALAQALSVFPLTSMSMLPVRLLVTTVPWWEVALALGLAAWSAWLLRRAAGKIFGAAMLLYGKEPSLRELWRWLREA